MTALEKMALEIVQKQAKNAKKENEKREQVGENQLSIAHYYEQNGDLMADPEIVFLKKEYSYGVEYYPIYERMSGLCSDVELVIFENRKPKMISRLQKQATSFCTTWMSTIVMQQGIGK